MPDQETRARLAARNVTIEIAPIVGLEGEAPGLAGVRLADRRLVEILALYLAPRTGFQSPIAEQLGCALDDGPFGPLPFRCYRWQNRRLAEQPLDGCVRRLAIALGRQSTEIVYWQANSKKEASARLGNGPEENRPI
jgi:hypothetical protein